MILKLVKWLELIFVLMMPKTKRLRLDLNRCRWKTNHIILIIYKAGEIDYVEYLHGMQQSLDLKMGHAEALKKYNQSVIDLGLISGSYKN